MEQAKIELNELVSTRQYISAKKNEIAILQHKLKSAIKKSKHTKFLNMNIRRSDLKDNQRDLSYGGRADEKRDELGEDSATKLSRSD